MLVRFVAVAIIGLSLLMAGLHATDRLAHHLAVGIIHCTLLTAPLALGVVILACSKAIAEWLSDKLDI